MLGRGGPIPGCAGLRGCRRRVSAGSAFAPGARRLRNTPSHICKLFECIIPVPVIYHFIQHVPASKRAFDLPLTPFRNFRPLKHIEYLKKAPNNIEIPPTCFFPPAFPRVLLLGFSGGVFC